MDDKSSARAFLASVPQSDEKKKLRIAICTDNRRKHQPRADASAYEHGKKRAVRHANLMVSSCHTRHSRKMNMQAPSVQVWCASGSDVRQQRRRVSPSMRTTGDDKLLKEDDTCPWKDGRQRERVQVLLWRSLLNVSSGTHRNKATSDARP